MLIDAPLRGTDKHGSGAYLAPRGDHLHQGIDIACHAGSKPLAVKGGRVTKIGMPYSWRHIHRRHLRYVEITDRRGYAARYFYVHTDLKVGDTVTQGQAVGVTQGLAEIYPGITDHFHFEVRDPQGRVIDPADYLETVPVWLV